MTSYQIFTDSCVDLTAEMAEQLGLRILPLSFEMDGKNYFNWPDNRDLDPTAFYNALRAGGASTTSQVPVLQFEEAFAAALEEGKDILYLGFSSGLSGTFSAGCVAMENLRERYPGRKMRGVDTLAASMGQGLLVYLAVQKQREGLSLDELADWVEATRLKLCHWFTVDDLMFLKRGGRVSGTAALFGTMLGIKPVMHVDDEGHLIPMEKVRGRKASLDALAQHMQDTAIDPACQTVFISHGDCLADCEYLAGRLRETMGVKDIHINFVGPVIGAHSGPGTVALFFLGEKR